MGQQELRSVSAVYNAVAKFSGHQEPNYVDFYSYALSTKNEKLVQSILLIPEEDFSKWEKLKGHLERYYFGKKDLSESKAESTWTERVTNSRIVAKSAQRSKTQA